ncbi:hypothetical protein [Planctomicrobium sp. SH664]|uniref:hypothetical protein n=1 Tax=Planctomicrobium sp. SH664 TaxID=3448125 RepID=UPI003F5CB9A0
MYNDMSQSSYNHSACFLATLALAGLLALTGCGNSGIPETVPVTGVIVYQDKPVPKGLITFEPIEIEEGRPHRTAVSFIEADGKYALSTFQNNDGAVPGKYKVRILSSRLELAQYNTPKDIEWLIPEKYTQANLSDIVIDVPANEKGPVILDIVLTD